MKVAKTHRGKKFLDDHAPKNQENRKQSLFIKGRKVSQDLSAFYEELAKFRHGEIKRYSRNNDILPFEDYSDIEQFCKKNYCSLFTFFSHNKKRPMDVIFGRLFNYHMMEMYEFGVTNLITSDPKQPNHLPKAEYDSGAIPALIFQGDQWETEFAPIRSVFMDFFVGDLKGTITEDQIQHALVFTIVQQGEQSTILVRHYQVHQGKPGSDSTLTLASPSFDLVPRRSQLPDEQLMKSALEKAVVNKKKKNITRNELGEEIGRVFTGKPDVNKIHPTRFKGLPKMKYERPAEPVDDVL